MPVFSNVVLNLCGDKEQILASVQGCVSAWENECHFVSAGLKICPLTGNRKCGSKISFPILNNKIMTTSNISLVRG